MAPRFDLSAVASLVTRDESPDATIAAQKKLTPTIIGGIIVAAAIGFGAALWLLIRFMRKRTTKKREEERGAAFLNVRGLVKEDDEKRCAPRQPRACALTPAAATASR